MKKFNVFVTLKGAGHSVEAPAEGNPIECINLASLLYKLQESIIDNDLVTTTRILIEEVPNDAE